jgi:RNA polymerase sigma factor (sigma-70 family)
MGLSLSHSPMFRGAPHRPEPDWQAISQTLRTYAGAIARTADEADELTQHTLATLLSRSPDHADHLGYAHKTMTRLWLDQQRSLRRCIARLVRLATIARPHHVDADHASRAEQTSLVRRAMEMLPPRQRAAIALRLIEGLEYEQIAAAMNCSVQTVRANLHLGRCALRRALGERP